MIFQYAQTNRRRLVVLDDERPDSPDQVSLTVSPVLYDTLLTLPEDEQTRLFLVVQAALYQHVQRVWLQRHGPAAEAPAPEGETHAAPTHDPLCPAPIPDDADPVERGPLSSPGYGPAPDPR